MNVIRNYIYNTLYQLMMLFVPLITMPYLTRIFTPDQMGINTYTLSIVTYFTYIGMLGMELYGNRQIASVRDDKEKLNTTFWSLYAIQLTSCTISLIIYCVFVLFCVNDNKLIYIIQSLNVVTVMFDIAWLFMGVEDFKKVSIRNTIIKMIGIVNIFMFIKSEDDLLLYIFLTAAVNILGSIIMWTYAPKYIKGIKIDGNIVKNTIKPLLLLFLPQISTHVYTLLAKTMIGNLTTLDQVAFYEYSQKIVRMVLSLVTSIGLVLMPKLANMIANGKNDQINEVVERAFKFVSYLCMPITMGLMAVSQPLVSWFLAPEYYEVGLLTSLSSVIIIAVSFANIIGIQYLVTTKQENKYTLSILISAGVNLVMNAIIIKPYGALGAVISLIFAEFMGVAIQMFLVRKSLDIKKMLLSVNKYFISSVIMAIIVYFIGSLISNKVLANVVQVITGGIIYFTIMLIIKDELQMQLINTGKTYIRNILSSRRESV